MSKKILIVDDAVFMREILQNIVEKEGYEVIAAVGNGKKAIPGEGRRGSSAIREKLTVLFGQEVWAEARVMYGGSVSPDDVTAYLKMEGVDGVLVGGASLNYEEFGKIVKVAQSLV